MVPSELISVKQKNNAMFYFKILAKANVKVMFLCPTKCQSYLYVWLNAIPLRGLLSYAVYCPETLMEAMDICPCKGRVTNFALLKWKLILNEFTWHHLYFLWIIKNLFVNKRFIAKQKPKTNKQKTVFDDVTLIWTTVWEFAVGVFYMTEDIPAPNSG